MRYARQEIDLLQFTQIDAEDPNDPDPPWNYGRVLWKGKTVPSLRSVSIQYGSGMPRITLTIVSRNDRGYKKDDPEFRAMMKDMLSRGVTIVGWPEEGDLS